MKKKILIVTSVASLILLGATFITFGSSLFIPEPEKELPVYHHVSFDTSGGSELSPIIIKHGDKIAKPDDPILFGHSVSAWKNQSNPWDFSKDVVTDDMVLTIEWELSNYLITYDFDGGTATEQMHDSYTIESSFTFAPAIKEDNVFLGWFDENNNRVDKLEKDTTGNISLKALWNDHLVFENDDPSRGTISIVGRDNDKNHITVSMVPNNHRHHVFNGWFDENDILLSKNATADFTLSSDKTNYVIAKFMDDAEEQDWNIAHGVIPSKTTISENVCVQYGMIPQSKVNDEVLINILNSLNKSSYNNYIYYDHEYYVSEKATHYYSDKDVFFNNEEIIEENVYYWFKVEPILWDILQENENLFLTSHYLLENSIFNRKTETRIIDDKTIYPSNYCYSPIREYLNNGFKNKVFFWNNETIEVEIDNSQDTTRGCDEKYLSENTLDFVFLLSYSELNDASLGFSNKYKRATLTTEYSRCQHAYVSLFETSYNCGCYMTRSPVDVDAGLSGSRVTINGNVNYAWVGNNYSLIKPCIYLPSSLF